MPVAWDDSSTWSWQPRRPELKSWPHFILTDDIGQIYILPMIPVFSSKNLSDLNLSCHKVLFKTSIFKDSSWDQ